LASSSFRVLPLTAGSSLTPGCKRSLYLGGWSRSAGLASLHPLSEDASTTLDISVGEGLEAFALRFSGWLKIESKGDYQFSVIGNGTSRIEISGQAVDLEGGNMLLTAGYHRITVEYYTRKGQAEFAAAIKSVDLDQQPLGTLLYRD
jgi:hypothetical protein